MPANESPEALTNGSAKVDYPLVCPSRESGNPGSAFTHPTPKTSMPVCTGMTNFHVLQPAEHPMMKFAFSAANFSAADFDETI